VRTRLLTCACCGSSAGRWKQHWNRDIGFGVCAKCIVWMKGRGTSDEEIASCYGTAGVNYESPEPAAVEVVAEKGGAS
jgi:hypothetical protein